MTRKEEIEQQTFVYYETCSDEDIAKSEGFIKGAEWADQHPREGLWDANKVVKWILENADKHIWYDETEDECGITDDFIEDLQKAMRNNTEN